MRVRSHVASLSAAVLATLCGGSFAQARDLIWDSNGATAPLGQDGSGNWDLANQNWVEGDLATGTNTTWSNANPDSAIFGTAANPATPPATLPDSYNIELRAPLVVQNLTFGRAANSASYNILDSFGDGSLTINGNVTKSTTGFGSIIQLFAGPLTLSAGDHVFALTDTPGDRSELTIDADLAGAGGVTLNNGAFGAYGTMVFAANNSYSGATTISNGRLVIVNSGGLGSTAAGTTISNAGTLAIGGAGFDAGDLAIGEAITITRNTYGPADSDFGRYNGAIVFTNDSTFNTHSINGPLTIDSTDARIAANSNRVVINSIVNATAGSVLTLGGDFAGFVELRGNQTGLAANGIRLVGGVQLDVSNDAQIGGPNSAIRFEGSATYHPVGGYATSFGAHTINATTFSGGINVDAGQQFTIDRELVAAPGVGSLGKRGTGTLNINSAVNLTGGQSFYDAGVVNLNASSTLHSLHLRSATFNIADGVTLTTTNNYSAIGQDQPDNGTLNLGVGSSLIAGNADFNVSDNAGTQGTINLAANSTLTVGGSFYMAKSNNTTATVNQNGGNVTINKGGDNSFVMGRGGNSGDRTNNIANYNKSAGNLTVAGEMWVGNGIGSVATFNNNGGDVTINNWFTLGRQGSSSTFNITAGTVTKQGVGNSFVDEGVNGAGSTMTVSGTGAYVAQTGEFWVGQAGGTGVLNIRDGGSVTVANNWMAVGREGGTGTVNIEGGSLVKAGNNWLTVGGSGNGRGTINMTAGSLTSSRTFLGEVNTAQGTMNLTGGTATFNGQFFMGRFDATRGTLNIGGTAVVNSVAISMGTDGTAGATINLSGGTFAVAGLLAERATGQRIFNWTGGTLAVDAFDLKGTAATEPASFDLVNAGTGTLAPGRVGAVGATAINDGGYVQAATAAMAIDIADAANFDRVTATGASTINGLISVDLLGTYVPAGGAIFDVFVSQASLAGAPVLGGPDASFFTASIVNGTTLRLVAVPEPTSFAAAALAVGSLGLRRRRRAVIAAA